MKDGSIEVDPGNGHQLLLARIKPDLIRLVQADKRRANKVGSSKRAERVMRITNMDTGEVSHAPLTSTRTNDNKGEAA